MYLPSFSRSWKASGEVFSSNNRATNDDKFLDLVESKEKFDTLFLLVYSLTLSDEYLFEKKKKERKTDSQQFLSLFVCFQFQARSVNEPNRETFLKWNENGKTSED